MISKIKIVDAITINEVNSLRKQYLDQLYEAQELYLELQVQKSRVYLIQYDHQSIGYFTVGEEDTLTEYFIISQYIHFVDGIFEQVVKSYRVKKALCISFNHTLLNCCVSLQKTMNVIGIHFRQYIAPGDWQLPVDLTIRPAEIKDEAIIINVNEEIFESDDEVTEYIEKGQILLFEKGSDLVGFGIFARVIEDRAEFDIGMLVTKEYRRQGYGRRIIRYMADYCQQKGWRPICGCAIENVASRRTLEKAGFIAGYRLLEFAF